MSQEPPTLLAKRLFEVYQGNCQERSEGSAPQVLFHYTTAEGLKSIVQSNSLWGTAAHYLNDASELEYGCKVAVETLTGWLDSNTAEPPFIVDAIKELASILPDHTSRWIRRRTVFVSCFCEHGNLLSQWRAYGNGGGYAIGFAVENGSLPLRTRALPYQPRLVKVLYALEEQKSVLRSAIKDLVSLMEERDPFEQLGFSNDQRYNLLVDYGQELLNGVIAGLKHQAFEQEREWRLVTARHSWVWEPRAEPVSDGGPRCTEHVRVRAVRGVLVPYVAFTPNTGKLPIVSIRIGPSLDLELAKEAVELLLEDADFSCAHIHGSDIPVRL